MAILLPFYAADAPAPLLWKCDCILIQIYTKLYLPITVASVATEVWFSCTYIDKN